MKIRMLTALFAAALLLCGCSSLKFTAYQVSGVFQGKGGIEREVDGVDFWEDGEPGRKYKILGLIEESHGQRLPLGSDALPGPFPVPATMIRPSPNSRTNREETPSSFWLGARKASTRRTTAAGTIGGTGK